MTDRERELIAGDGEDSQQYVAISRVRRKIDDELPEDVELLREHHPQLYGELREVVCDNSPDPDTLRKLAKCRTERDDLQAALAECRKHLAAADGVDHEAIRRATADIEAALERADGQAIETAVQEIRDALEDP